jgi:hypothetical protein
VAFKSPYVCDFKVLSRQQATVIQNHDNANFRYAENIRGLNLAAVRDTTVRVSQLLSWNRLERRGIICFIKPGLTRGLYKVYTYVRYFVEFVNIVKNISIMQ